MSPSLQLKRGHAEPHGPPTVTARDRDAEMRNLFTLAPRHGMETFRYVAVRVLAAGAASLISAMAFGIIVVDSSQQQEVAAPTASHPAAVIKLG